MNDILNLPDDLEWWRGRAISPEQVFKYFNAYKCEWLYEGDPSPDKPHAKLASGECSSGYYNCRRLFSMEPNLCAIFAEQLVRRIKELDLIGRFDYVAGSSYSAITLSYEVAKITGVSHVFTEKHPDNPKEQIWNGDIPSGSKVLQVEESTGTLGTAWKVRRAINRRDERIVFLPYICVVVHRPSKLSVDYGNLKVISLAEKELWAGGKNECPYCEAGSLPCEPKTVWAEFVGKD